MRKLIIVLATMVFLSSCIFQGCEEETKSEVLAPDGNVIAVLFERDCGATTSFITHVNLRLRTDQFQRESSGTIVDGQVFIIRGRCQIKLTWEGPKSLLVERLDCYSDEHSKVESKWQDITVTVRSARASGDANSK